MSCPKVIMSDYNDANIIVDAGNVERVVGVIDFGDSLSSWRVNDVAIGMAYAAVSAYGKQRPITAAACLLRGFTEWYQLEAVEAKHLLTLAAGRLAISVTIGNYSYMKDPSNAYLLIHAEPAWTTLATLW
jgi:Ser/Thr protein kinase RdoA (MazF antagonist)